MDTVAAHGDPIAVLCTARYCFSTWRARLSALADASIEAPAAVREISQQLKRVDLALRAAAAHPPKGWTEEVAAYRAELQNFHVWLANLDMTLRIQRAQMNERRGCIRAMRDWSDLARQIS
jgi:hypothetical protein